MRITLFFLLISGLLFAQTDKTSALSNDATMQESSRKSVLGFGYMGATTLSTVAPMSYTPYKGEARKLPDMRLSTTQGFLDGLLARHFDLLITDRYDKIILGPTTTIVTPLERVDIENPAPAYNATPMGREAFAKNVHTYLDSYFGKTISYLLAQTLDARYQALQGIEKTTFMATKAKEVGVPVEMLEQLMGAAYAFSLHADAPSATATITQVQHTDSKGNTYYAYVHSVNVAQSLSLIVSQFNATTGLFEIYTTIPISFSDGASHEQSVRDTSPQLFAQLYEAALAQSFKAAVLALQVRLKNDKNFAMHGTVTESTLFSLAISPGNQESIRTDQPFKVMRSINDEMHQIGWLKAITPGNTCLRAPAQERTTTTARMISGWVDQYDQVVEYGYSGVYSEIAYTKDPTIITNNWGGANGNYLTFKEVADLGYIGNSPSLSEIYSYGLASVGLIESINASARPVILGKNTQFQGILGANFALGMERRWYLLAGFGVAAGADIGMEAQLYDGGKTGETYTDDNGDTQDVYESLMVAYFYLRPHVSAFFSPDPYFTLYAQVAQAFDVSLASISYSKEYHPSLQGDEIGFGGMIQAMQFRVGVAWHTDFIGDMANSYRKSNGACAKYSR
ncbi:MAG: hypothetical protein KU37_07155 [Sulfuricurvum sp. PC08-66]|nr:MAG: hypothetical protein KU37_07155 [Sulfuricurvum sp. PC08-66]